MKYINKKNARLVLPIILFILVSMFFCGAELSADILYLKNGRSLEGLIKEEGKDFVELEVFGGTVKLNMREIERIEKSAPEQMAAILKKWEKKKIENQEMILKRQLEEERKPKKIEKKVDFLEKTQHIVLTVLLNKKIEASLILDTGASLIVLKKDIGKKLGIDLKGVNPDVTLILPDGRKMQANHIILESVKVENVEAKNVEAALMLDDAGELHFGDGLLGMSFLKQFNFKVDQKGKKLILEKF